MTRTPAVPAARHFRTGALRQSAPGSSLQCLVLVEGPDWVVADLATGALLRPFASDALDTQMPSDGRHEPAPAPRLAEAEPPGAPAAASLAAPSSGEPPLAAPAEPVGAARHIGPPLSTVGIVLAEEREPMDPSRPEAVRVARNELLAPARRRAVRRLLGKLVTRAPHSPLLGSLGPSVAYTDLEGLYPSVVVIQPDQRPRFGNGPTGPWCQFSLAGRKHALPLQSRPEDVLGSAGSGREKNTKGKGRERHGANRRRHNPGASAARLLVVGYGVPRHGQVPKVVLGALSEQPLR